jgi:hypothetical protein
MGFLKDQRQLQKLQDQVGGEKPKEDYMWGGALHQKEKFGKNKEDFKQWIEVYFRHK